MPSSRKKQNHNGLKRPAVDHMPIKLTANEGQNKTINDNMVVTNDMAVEKFLNHVFTENKSHLHRLAAVEVMSEYLDKMAVEDVHSHTMTWLTHLIKTMELCKGSNAGELALCCHTISQLLVLCHDSAELRRVISVNIVPKLLASLLEIKMGEVIEDVGLVASITLMKICIKYFGGACIAFKNKVEAYVSNVALCMMDDHNSAVVETCVSTLAYLPYCGGQGSSGTKHTEMWTNQMARLLHAVGSLTTYLYTPCGVTSKDVFKDDVPGQAFPVITAGVSAASLVKAAHYLSVYVKTLQSMITTPFHWKCQLPIKHLLSVICNLTSVTPDSVVFKRPNEELEAVCGSLADLHDEAIKLLASLAKLCGSSLYSYTTTVADLLSSQLQWTRTMVDISSDNKYIVSRSLIYDTVNTILSEPGLYTTLNNITDIIIEHALYDIRATTVTQSEAVPQPVSKKSRKSNQKPVNPSVVRNVRTPNERVMMASTLTVLTQLLSQSAVCLTTRHVKLVYDSLVTLTLRVQRSLTIDSYTVDSNLRQALYRCLLSSIFSYNSEVGPLTHIATGLLSKGMVDKCPQVRSLCNQSLMVCQLAVQPRAPALQHHKSSFLAEANGGEHSKAPDAIENDNRASLLTHCLSNDGDSNSQIAAEDELLDDVRGDVEPTNSTRIDQVELEHKAENAMKYDTVNKDDEISSSDYEGDRVASQSEVDDMETEEVTASTKIAILDTRDTSPNHVDTTPVNTDVAHPPTLTKEVTYSGAEASPAELKPNEELAGDVLDMMSSFIPDGSPDDE